MTFDPKLKKYIPSDPTQNRFIFPTSYHDEIDHKKLEWAFHGLGQKNPYYIFTSTNCR